MVTRIHPRKFSDPNHQLRPQAKEKVADDFCEAIEAWLKPHNIILSPDAQGSIVESITEALDNAERHGWPENEDDLGDWSMAGFCRLKSFRGSGDFGPLPVRDRQRWRNDR